MADKNDLSSLYADLKNIEDTTFPKKCGTCDKVYNTLEEYIADTEQLRPGVTGFEESCDDEDKPILGLYRNCKCGSTLLNFFGDRRDSSEIKTQRRKHFGVLLEKLVSRGIDRNVARNELLKVVRGEYSELLTDIIGNQDKEK